ncbi:hypothetical protein BV898_16224 [Hypsibius exemplaris]|uniref:Uncharacterized protein n=1 Tax=Hypsibius exemplaris TaxID=2072580 RepID=A0A9X6RL30_HYPEX|nr:hypothetical protein BV898_16224 [Hypsibius exemplaris]
MAEMQDICKGKVDAVLLAATATIRRSARDIRFPSQEELELLGAPLMTDGVSATIEKKPAAITFLTGRLSLLVAHQALFLFKNCLAAPKMLHLLRCSRTRRRPDKLVEFDIIIRSSLAVITNTAMTDAVYKQTSLRVSKSGFGIR